ncbi:branched-chain amino acid ABC transporter permease [Pseudoduganella namucuonensis]|uniref:Amino acid/amide ABC transporter membrane protein 2, HAAT family n=1 Tax=Pseudoduganella namucuonensis TaxID=1035707 RepID=A0A1I7LPQ7_9BURK|nr:branched-chain amino acid ABC transporter permease [Pseudoduganella namucuonensis]SFV11550.1 amino acid/amide ABC transporter membrane protein 2, HAAT family [Pseudoduganella namucuonensis]
MNTIAIQPGAPRLALSLGLIMALAGLAVLPALLPSFMLLQLSLTLTYAMAILGLNLLLGYSGQVCLAQGAFFACGAYTTGILAAKYGWDPLLTLPVAALAAAAVGVLIGLPALRLGGLQLAIMTFGIAMVAPQLILKLERYTNGVTGLGIDQPAPPAWFPASAEVWLYCLCVAGAALCVLLMLRLVRGDTGRTLRALRDNPKIAEALGVNLTRTRLAVFAVSSGFAGLAGGLYAIVNAYISPQSFLAAKSIEILIGAIVGGIASIGGAFLGAAFVVFVPEWSAEIDPAIGGLVYGCCLIAMMLLARQGLAGLAAQLRRRFGARLAPFTAFQRPRTPAASNNQEIAHGNT